MKQAASPLEPATVVRSLIQIFDQHNADLIRLLERMEGKVRELDFSTGEKLSMLVEELRGSNDLTKEQRELFESIKDDLLDKQML
jgi:hypothetical protein